MAAPVWKMAAVIHTTPRRKRFMSPVCLLFVPWHCLAPLLTPQTRVTQPLSNAYSCTAYPLRVWRVGGCVLPRQMGVPLWRQILFLCDSTGHSKCIMVAACPVQSFCLQHAPFQQRALGWCTHTGTPHLQSCPYCDLPLCPSARRGPRSSAGGSSSGSCPPAGQRSG